jgi:hypothetical protein
MTNDASETPSNRFKSDSNIAPSVRQTSNSFAYAVAAVLCVFVWVFWTSFWDKGLYGDNVEQFIWSHSLEWGYHKHPPLPTWLLAAAISLAGPAWWLTNALAAICVAATGVFTWLIARRLASQSVADTTAVLWGLQQCFSISAEIYNHNTVLVLCLAATTYCLIRGLEPTPQTAWHWWAATGALAACAMLSKYQAGLVIASLGIAALIISKRRGTAIVLPVTLAFCIFAAMLLPHLYWGYTNQFPSLRYASEIVESGGFFKRLFWQLTFAANQIRMNLPLIGALLLSCLAAAIWRQKQGTTVEIDSPVAINPTYLNIWLWALLWGPIVAVLALSFTTGSPLRNHWGVQLFQFLPLWIATFWHHQQFLQLKNLIPATVLVHCLGLTYYALKQNDPEEVLATRRADSAYPAQKLSTAALSHWKSATNCPLKIVVGDFEAGLVSVFAKDFPVVSTSPIATPWVTDTALGTSGALYVLDSNTTLPANALLKTNWTIATGKNGTQKYVQFAVRLPAESCLGARQLGRSTSGSD